MGLEKTSTTQINLRLLLENRLFTIAMAMALNREEPLPRSSATKTMVLSKQPTTSLFSRSTPVSISVPVQCNPLNFQPVENPSLEAVLFLDGELLLLAEALLTSSGMSAYHWSLMKIAEQHMVITIFWIPCSALVREERTLAKEILVDLLLALTSLPELSHGDMDVPTLITQVFTLKYPISLIGSMQMLKLLS